MFTLCWLLRIELRYFSVIAGHPERYLHENRFIYMVYQSTVMLKELFDLGFVFIFDVHELVCGFHNFAGSEVSRWKQVSAWFWPTFSFLLFLSIKRGINHFYFVWQLE